jgi:hypothetical protein
LSPAGKISADHFAKKRKLNRTNIQAQNAEYCSARSDERHSGMCAVVFSENSLMPIHALDNPSM